jgi:hypothetical protein
MPAIAIAAHFLPFHMIGTSCGNYSALVERIVNVEGPGMFSAA